jgi:hypothetical protein
MESSRLPGVVLRAIVSAACIPRIAKRLVPAARRGLHPSQSSPPQLFLVLSTAIYRCCSELDGAFSAAMGNPIARLCGP